MSKIASPSGQTHPFWGAILEAGPTIGAAALTSIMRQLSPNASTLRDLMKLAKKVGVKAGIKTKAKLIEAIQEKLKESPDQQIELPQGISGRMGRPSRKESKKAESKVPEADPSSAPSSDPSAEPLTKPLTNPSTADLDEKYGTVRPADPEQPPEQLISDKQALKGITAGMLDETKVEASHTAPGGDEDPAEGGVEQEFAGESTSGAVAGAPAPDDPVPSQTEEEKKEPTEAKAAAAAAAAPGVESKEKEKENEVETSGVQGFVVKPVGLSLLRATKRMDDQDVSPDDIETPDVSKEDHDTITEIQTDMRDGIWYDLEDQIGHSNYHNERLRIDSNLLDTEMLKARQEFLDKQARSFALISGTTPVVQTTVDREYPFQVQQPVPQYYHIRDFRRTNFNITRETGIAY